MSRSTLKSKPGNPTPSTPSWTNTVILVIAALVALAAGFGAARAVPTAPTSQPVTPPPSRPTSPPVATAHQPSPTATPRPSPTPPPERLSLTDLQSLLKGSNPPLLVDVRTPEFFAQGHLPGAINLPLAEIGTRLKELPTDRLIVTYCS